MTSESRSAREGRIDGIIVAYSGATTSLCSAARCGQITLHLSRVLTDNNKTCKVYVEIFYLMSA